MKTNLTKLATSCPGMDRQTLTMAYFHLKFMINMMVLNIKYISLPFRDRDISRPLPMVYMFSLNYSCHESILLC